MKPAPVWYMALLYCFPISALHASPDIALETSEHFCGGNSPGTEGPSNPNPQALALHHWPSWEPGPPESFLRDPENQKNQYIISPMEEEPEKRAFFSPRGENGLERENKLQLAQGVLCAGHNLLDSPTPTLCATPGS